MYLLYFVLWIVFNGKITLEICIFGLVIATAIFAFTCKFMDYSLEKEKRLMKNVFRLIRYLGILVVEVVKANFAVAHLILTEKEEPQPTLVRFRSDLKTSMGKALLADAITLTPGTITVQLEENEYTVHCLDESMADGLDDSVFQEEIAKMEEK